jgi:hypothetical protein
MQSGTPDHASAHSAQNECELKASIASSTARLQFAYLQQFAERL